MSVGPREFIFIQMYYAQGWSDHRQFELSLHPQENSFINVNDVTLQRTENKTEGEKRRKERKNLYAYRKEAMGNCRTTGS